MSDSLVFKLHERQSEALESSSTELLYGGAASGGKQVPLTEPVPTPSGWSTIGELKVGDLLFTELGRTCAVTHLHPIDLTPKSYLLTFDDGTEIKACADHLWYTFNAAELMALTRLDPGARARRRAKRPSRAQGNKSEKFRSAISASNSARQYEYKEPVGGVRTTQEICDTLTVRGRSNHAVPVAKALELPEIDLPLDPYCLGAWLGDGTRGCGGFAGIDPEIWQEFEKCGFKMTHSKTQKARHHILGISGLLRAEGVLLDKHVPAKYLRASRAQRLALLQGLMDTDGTTYKTGGVEFTNTNKRIADAAHELILSLGWKARMMEGRAKLNGEDYGPVWNIKWTPNEPVFRLPRKIARQNLKPSRKVNFRYIVSCVPCEPVPMRCLTVDNPTNLFLIGRSMVPTHNSHLARVLSILWATEIPGIQIFLFRRLYADLNLNHLQGPTGFNAMLAPLTNARDPRSPLIAGKLCEIVDGEIRFWNGSKIHMCHLQHQKDLSKYYGPEFHVLFLEEATQFSEYMIRFLRSRCRIPKALKIPDKYRKPVSEWRVPGEPDYYFPRIVYTSNPGGVSHAYVKRCFLTGFQPYEMHKAPLEDGGYTRQYIPARVDDNPSVNREAVKEGLSGLPPRLVDAMLNGNWDAVIGAFFPEVSPPVHLIQPFAIPDHWLRFTAYDHGSAGDGDPFAHVWFAVSPGGALPRGSLVVYRVWTGKGLPKTTASQIAKGILDRERNDGAITYRVAGGDILEQRGHGPSIFEIFATEGVVFQRADNRRASGWMQLRERLVGKQGVPLLYFFNTFSDDVDSLANLQHDLNNVEDCAAGDDHFADAVRYGCTSRPFVRDQPAAEKTLEQKFKKPTLSELWEEHERARQYQRD